MQRNRLRYYIICRKRRSRSSHVRLFACLPFQRLLPYMCSDEECVCATERSGKPNSTMNVEEGNSRVGWKLNYPRSQMTLETRCSLTVYIYLLCSLVFRTAGTWRGWRGVGGGGFRWMVDFALVACRQRTRKSTPSSNWFNVYIYIVLVMICVVPLNCYVRVYLK